MSASSKTPLDQFRGDILVDRVRFFLIVTLAVFLPEAASAQQQPQRPPSEQAAADSLSARLGRAVTPDEVRQAILRSGLSEQEIRSRLQAGGYDPGLADPFFAAPGDTAFRATPQQASGFVQALTELGLLSSIDGSADSLSVSVSADSLVRDSLRSPRNERVFGRDIFRRNARMFEPSSTGPVDPSYRLGVGDRVQLIMTGGVEFAYSLEVRSDGTIIVPQVGQIGVAGLTLDAARALVRNRAGQVYSGVGSGRVNVDLSVARVRASQVFVIGEAEVPGAHQVSALSTVFHAIARAGGPTERGSFRRIELRRAGRVVRSIDLYNYLLRGDASDDIRIEQGDIIFVPLADRVVSIHGAVRRPATYQLVSGETLADLLQFAGGFLPSAVSNRVQIDRILPPERREAGVDRVVVDVALQPGSNSPGAAVPLFDGDVVRAFSIGGLRRNSVVLSGEVFQPGLYELRDGMTLSSLIESARGFMPWALSDRVKVTRLLPQSGRRTIFSLDYSSPEARAFELAEFDSVIVLDGRILYPSGVTAVLGAVNKPDSMPYVERQTLRDAIDRAGGFREDAAIVEVSRRRVGQQYMDTTSTLFTFPVSGFDSPGGGARFVLERDDRVFVRAAPGFRDQRFVRVSGLFRYPGHYALTRDNETVRELVQRAGGTLPGAYGESFRLLRDGKLVAIDYDAAMRGDRRADIRLQAGDHLTIAPNPNTVYVTGEVNRSALVLYQPGRSLDEYIALAGGARPNGDPDKSIVDYPSGMVRRASRHLKVFRSTPEIVAGSVITVPAKPPAKDGQFERALTTTVQVVTTLTSLLIAYVAVKR